MDQAIESRLNEWRARLTTISRNVMDLSESASTKRIAAKARGAYTGVTAQRASEALRRIEDLWLDYLLLARVVEDAAELAAKDGFFRHTGAQVLALLDGDSVELPAVHVPLPARDLLTDASQSERTTLAKVLEAMQSYFMEARDTLARVAEAESKLMERVAKLTAQSDQVTQHARMLGAPAVALAIKRHSIEEIQSDPLGCALEADRLEAGIANQKALIQSMETERVELCAKLSEARNKLQALLQLIAGSRSAVEEVRLKIAAPAEFVAPLDEGALAPLEDWLSKLDATAAEGRWSALAVGLRRWENACEVKMGAARDGLAANRKLLEERADLRGRFQAFCAKIKAMEKRGTGLDPDLKQIMAETQQTLDARPCDLAAARSAVAAFEKLFLNRRD